jgi:hypothetical protein
LEETKPHFKNSDVMEIDKWENLQNFRNLVMFNVAWQTLFHNTIEWKVLRMANEGSR